MDSLFYISFSIFTIYTVFVVAKFGVPHSISESFYLLGRSWLFYVFCSLVALPLLVFWLSKAEGSEWMVFLSCAGLIFVGHAPRFREGELMQHFSAAAVCLLFSQLWLVFYGCWVVPAVLFPLAFFIGGKFKGMTEFGRAKHSRVFFVEIAAFLSVYISLFVKYLI